MAVTGDDAGDSTAETVFEARDVGFHYPHRPDSLTDITFQVRRGERIALLGANGSGKSTLLHLLDGLYFATSGVLTALGRPLTEETVDRPPFGPRFRREVGFLFQHSDAQLFNPTLEDEIAFGPLQAGLSPAESRVRVEETIQLLGLERLRGRTPQTLSAGEQKQVALASLLAVAPSVLLLDEPTAGLDPRSRVLLLDLLDDLSARGFTLITATHDLRLVEDLADRALVLGEDHRLAAEGPATAILKDRALLLSANLIASRSRRGGRLDK